MATSEKSPVPKAEVQAPAEVPQVATPKVATPTVPSGYEKVGETSTGGLVVRVKASS